MKGSAQTEVIDRPVANSAIREPEGLKTILFHVSNDDFVMDRLQVTLALARVFEAHMHCLHVTPIEAYTIVDAYGGTFVSGEIVRVLEDEAAKLRGQIEGQLAKEDVSWDYEQLTGELIPRLIQRAALADLVVVGREPRDREFGGQAVTLLGDMLMRGNTPLLVLDDQDEFDPFGTAVIAWNGSYEAANAVRASLPLLRLASDVRVVCFAEERDRLFPSTTLLEYLSRQGVKAELDIGPVQPAAIDIGIIEYALRRHASYVVIGAYSHNRAGEFLFGGVTRSLLKDCPLPLVVAH